MIKVKIIERDTVELLEVDVNHQLNLNLYKNEIIDIKYDAIVFEDYCYYSAMIIYKEEL